MICRSLATSLSPIKNFCQMAQTLLSVSVPARAALMHGKCQIVNGIESLITRITKCRWSQFEAAGECKFDASTENAFHYLLKQSYDRQCIAWPAHVQVYACRAMHWSPFPVICKINTFLEKIFVLLIIMIRQFLPNLDLKSTHRNVDDRHNSYDDSKMGHRWTREPLITAHKFFCAYTFFIQQVVVNSLWWTR